MMQWRRMLRLLLLPLMLLLLLLPRYDDYYALLRTRCSRTPNASKDQNQNRLPGGRRSSPKSEQQTLNSAHPLNPTIKP